MERGFKEFRNSIINELELSDNISDELIPDNDSLDKFIIDTVKFTDGNINAANISKINFNKMLAMAYLAKKEEIKAINHLVESHAVFYRQHVKLRYHKSEWRKEHGFQNSIHGLKDENLELDIKDDNSPSSLRNRLSELPPDWYMIQITAPYKVFDFSDVPETHPLHLTVLPTGDNPIPPFCITLPKPENDIYDICREIKSLLSRNKAELRGSYNRVTYPTYLQMRNNQSRIMKEAVNEIETVWLREWRILFIADPVDISDSTQDLHNTIDKLIADDSSKIKLSLKENWLLKKIASCSFCLSKVEILRAVQYILKDNIKLAKNIALSIQSKLSVSANIKNEKRKPLILLLDEELDYLPFEAMDILINQPVTRFASIHIAYALFKEHEDTIIDGYKVIELSDSGTYIVNPEDNLPKMSKRLKLFIDYWLPEWNGLVDKKPNKNEFINALTNNDIMMYNGHGNGIQFLGGEEIERMKVKSLELLFGCSSVKLFFIGGPFPPYGVSNNYLMACSPCIMGALWEVTDGEIDKITVNFMSKWIPSKASRHWSDFDIEQWINGILKLKSCSQLNKSNETYNYEPDLLKAIAEAKQTCSQFMTCAAIIVRGLPVKLKY